MSAEAVMTVIPQIGFDDAPASRQLAARRRGHAGTSISFGSRTDRRAHEQMPTELVVAQMRAAFAANPVAAVKIGMLWTAAVIGAVGSVLASNPQVPVVLDPVLYSTSGRALLEDGAINALRRDLMPICRLVTRNLIELARLNGSAPVPNEKIARLQGEGLSRTIRTAVRVKGGHAEGAWVIDVLLQPNYPAVRFEAARLQCGIRGTGCMLSSAIAASLALGASLEEGVRGAKRYVFDALAGSG